MMAVRISRRGFKNCEQTAKWKRSAGRKLGARRRERRMTSSCRLSRRFSARRTPIPRFPRNVTRAASRRRVGNSKFFMPITLSRITIKARRGRSGSQSSRTPNSPCRAPKRTQFVLHCTANWGASIECGMITFERVRDDLKRRRARHCRVAIQIPRRTYPEPNYRDLRMLSVVSGTDTDNLNTAREPGQ
jgi:hypothetical protein